MEADVPAGKYILAVSGGVDSIVLMDLLAKEESLEIIVAHFDHGLRVDSSLDTDFVAAAAEKYGLTFEIARGDLPALASEDEARRARYLFLNRMADKHRARAIITAHHQDDLIETALINLIRGTGPRGLIAILENKSVMRPLAGYPKSEIIKYAKTCGLQWREDPTNNDDRYLRNQVRRAVVANMSQDQRREILDRIEEIRTTYHETERLIRQLYKDVLVDERTISRPAFSQLPTSVSNRLIHSWLGDLGVINLDKRTVERLAVGIKTGARGTRQDIKQGAWLYLTEADAQFNNTFQTG